VTGTSSIMFSFKRGIGIWNRSSWIRYYRQWLCALLTIKI
jgi:hypothetical protein